MPCSRNDVVLPPIPFTDLSSHKVRPAIVIGLSFSPSSLANQDWSKATVSSVQVTVA